jgi:sugar phosphate permease
MKKPELNAAPPAEWTEQRIHRSAKQLFLYCFLAYGCSYIGRKNFAACLPAMLDEGLLTETVGGYITTAYMLLYGMGQLVSGLVAARVKPQYMIGTGLLGAAICNACMGLVTEPWLMPVIWAGNGLFHSMLWAPIIRVFTDRMPPDRRAWAGTNIVASCSIGAVLAFLIPSLVLRLSGWRVVFLVSGGILFFALLVWVVGHRFLRGYVRMMDEACRVEREALRMMADAKAAAEHRKVKRSLPAVILASGLWFLLLCLFCNGALRDGVETWAPTFLSASFGLDSSAAALIAVAYCRFRGKTPSFLLHGTVCLYLALRMVCRYQIWSADPQLQHYAFYLGAHVAVMLGCYQQTALDAGSGDCRSLWRWCLAATYLCLTALPGSEDPFFLLCCGIWMLSNLTGGKGD